MNSTTPKKRGGGIRPIAAAEKAENRMKPDQVKIGIRVSEIEENGIVKRTNSRRFQPIGNVKRKIEAPPSPPPMPPPRRSSIPVNVSVDGIKRSPVLVKKGGKEISKSVDGIKMLRSEISKGSEEFCKEIVEFVPKDSVSVLECQTSFDSETNSAPDEEKGIKEFSVCEENVNSNPKITIEEDEVEEFDEEEEEIEIELKEMNVPKIEEEIDEEFEEEEFDEEFEEEIKIELKEMNVPESIPPIYTNPPPKHTQSSYDHNQEQNFPHSHNKLQNLVDLVMWRDVSRSTFVFGIGTFIILSSSYTQDINFSFISAISYLGLVYLGAIFLYRSIICRGIVEIDEGNCVLGEEEAVWFLELFLPYLNEFLLKLRALFSGDPVTTMKLAVLLFFLARCGSYITFWKMAKLGFFGVFTVPKVCSCYSHQLTAYGKFWIRRFRDAWDSCTHKKAVAIGIFTIVWNLSSTVARIWAAFMLFVALRYYQQTLLVAEEWTEVEEEVGKGSEEILLSGNGYQRGGPARGRQPSFVEANLPNKLKKRL